MATRVLLIGSGGREHTLAWKLAQSPDLDDLIVAPGSDAIGKIARVEPVQTGELDGIVDLARRERIDLVVVGPEQPLVDGLADRLRAAGVAVFGPGAGAAQLEGSKAFAKELMARHGVPTASFSRHDSIESALEAVRSGAGRLVVKADGLAAGKGVMMARDRAEAEAALVSLMQERVFGDAGASVVLEEWMDGEEASIFAISDGERFVVLPPSQDHKRIGDGDTGPNTGGMGAYAPAPVVDDAMLALVRERVLAPTLAGLRAEGHEFRGLLYAGLMISPSGEPRVVEFNVRFGDPETQCVLPLVAGDLLPWLEGAARGQLPAGSLELSQAAAVTVVLASAGYPASSTRGVAIEGLDEEGGVDGAIVFHAGTMRDPSGAWLTAGGRVLGITGVGTDLQEARDRAYSAAARIHSEGALMRTDIAVRGLERLARRGSTSP